MKIKHLAMTGLCFAFVASFATVNATELDSDPAVDNEGGKQLTDEAAVEEMESLGFTIQDDLVFDQAGVEIPPMATGDSSAENSSATSESGEALDLEMDSSAELDDEASCYRWWLHGNHRWGYKRWWHYTSAAFNTNTWTTYGTNRGSCGTPLVVDRLYQRANIASGSWGRYSFSQVGYKKSRITKTLRATTFGIGAPCGMRVYHQSLNRGVKWYNISRSGCLR